MDTRDLETGRYLRYPFVGFTSSLQAANEGLVLGNNVVAAGVNMDTFFAKGRINSWLFCNYNDKLQEIFPYPETDKESLDGVYMVYVVSQGPTNSENRVYALDRPPNEFPRTRSLIGLITFHQLEKEAPKTLKVLQLQRIHFGLSAEKYEFLRPLKNPKFIWEVQE